MIKEDVVLILGAGASNPYGLPLGGELLDEIFSELEYERPRKDNPNYLGTMVSLPFIEYDDDTKSSKELVNILLKKFTRKEIEHFRISLKKAQLDSIDAFLEHRADFREIGKMAIAYVLLKYEREEALFFENSDWYKYLWNKLNASFDNFRQNKLSVITFNYDRSLEFYLFNCFKSLFDREDAITYAMISSIQIVHLHGKLGFLPWENGEVKVKYGQRVDDFETLRKISGEIKIIHENEPNTPSFQKAHELIASASRICFMGFGYSETNLDRLKIKSLPRNKNISGTATGFTEMEIEKLQNRTEGRIVLYSSATCLSFLRNQPF